MSPAARPRDGYQIMVRPKTQLWNSRCWHEIKVLVQRHIAHRAAPVTYITFLTSATTNTTLLILRYNTTPCGWARGGLQEFVLCEQLHVIVPPLKHHFLHHISSPVSQMTWTNPVPQYNINMGHRGKMRFQNLQVGRGGNLDSSSMERAHDEGPPHMT